MLIDESEKYPYDEQILALPDVQADILCVLRALCFALVRGVCSK